MPNLTIYQPPNNLVVQLNQPFLVTGQASDVGPPEPVRIQSVTVQIDDGPVIRATLTHIPNKTMMLVSFKAMVEVTGGLDPHTVTVTVTNENDISVTETRQVFTGAVFEVDLPAVLIDLFFPFALDLNDPTTASLMNSWVSQIQTALIPLSTSLASVGKVLAGPNLFPATDPVGRTILRMGLWIEDSDFPVIAAAPPDFPLPRLLDQAAAAGFATVAVQLAPPVSLPDPPSLPGPSFALFIPIAALQHLLDAVTPTVQAAASQNSVSVDTITVQTSSPGSVTTSFSGQLPGNLVGFTVTITEVLGTEALPDVQPPQSAPAVIGSSHSASVGNILDWFVGFLLPLFGLTLLSLLGALGAISDAAGQIAGKINGIAGPLISGIPSRIPFRNTALPPIPLAVPDFPVLIPDWQTLRADGTGILGTGTTIIAPRDQTMVSLSIDGVNYIPVYQGDIAGGTGQTYNYTLVNLAPDSDKFNWQVSGSGSRSGSIQLGAFGQAGSFGADFKLSFKTKPGIYPFALTVNATETCGTDPSKTLSASTSMAVQVEVKQKPKTSP